MAHFALKMAAPSAAANAVLASAIHAIKTRPLIFIVRTFLRWIYQLPHYALVSPQPHARSPHQSPWATFYLLSLWWNAAVRRLTGGCDIGHTVAYVRAFGQGNSRRQQPSWSANFSHVLVGLEGIAQRECGVIGVEIPRIGGPDERAFAVLIVVPAGLERHAFVETDLDCGEW